mmetsp:Transcript_25307/g.69765  ORF Transcript_25307/g.69765 Transcript_25307/m.69765 type:complete len:89 (-) Transcript_25307:307-573(-)
MTSFERTKRNELRAAQCCAQTSNLRTCRIEDTPSMTENARENGIFFDAVWRLAVSSFGVHERCKGRNPVLRLKPKQPQLSCAENKSVR